MFATRVSALEVAPNVLALGLKRFRAHAKVRQRSPARLDLGARPYWPCFWPLLVLLLALLLAAYLAPVDMARLGSTSLRWLGSASSLPRACQGVPPWSLGPVPPPGLALGCTSLPRRPRPRRLHPYRPLCPGAQARHVP